MQSPRKQTRRTGLCRTGTALFLGLALCVANLGAGMGNHIRLATFSDPSGEEVGTLPSVYISPSLELPALALTGTKADVHRLIEGVGGLDPAAGISELADGRTRFVLYGEVDVSLDRELLARCDVDVSLQVGPLFAGGVSQLCWNGEANALQTLPVEGDVPLGLDLFGQNTADVVQAQLKLVSLRRMSSGVEIEAVGNRVQILLQHPN